ncbi:MAG TPA: MBL fold metallo-hydrolase [Frankiaceae bacterium]|nr:MBL fold metallo-hydrolase [Frankiaceae bacterium]
MQTRVDEVADGIYRLETVIEEAAPGGFGFNQFVVLADEPLLFHTGHRGMFPLVSEAVARLVPLDRLRWISFGHVEADECGALNDFLAAAPNATALHSRLGTAVSIADLADRPPHALAHGEVIDLGGKRIRLLETPHVPHNWEAIMLFEETTRTLLAGDLGSNLKHGHAFVDSGVVESTFETDEAFPGVASLSAGTGERIRALADLAPETLAVMHGASYRGDVATVLRDLAAGYDDRVRAALDAGLVTA